MNPILADWNALDPHTAAHIVLPCNGSHAWARALALARPVASEDTLYATSDAIWNDLPAEAWLEAFASPPRLGQSKPPAHAQATPQSLTWSDGEQSQAQSDAAAKEALAEGNRLYESKFGRTFIVCATGKSAAEILSLLNHRLANTPQAELLEAAEQQRQITQLRLRKWLTSQP
jgi:2-oxo-4-hydroxy-4-carboxy-5-ureidoimidazoline decarboxylase